MYQGVPMEVLDTSQNLPLVHQRPFSRKLTDFWPHYRAGSLEGEPWPLRIILTAPEWRQAAFQGGSTGCRAVF